MGKAVVGDEEGTSRLAVPSGLLLSLSLGRRKGGLAWQERVVRASAPRIGSTTLSPLLACSNRPLHSSNSLGGFQNSWWGCEI